MGFTGFDQASGPPGGETQRVVEDCGELGRTVEGRKGLKKIVEGYRRLWSAWAGSAIQF